MALLGARTRRAVALLGLTALLAPLASGGAGAHVGLRLRLGYRPDPVLAVLARMTEVYVEEVSGYSIDLKEYGDAGSLQKAVGAGDVDVAVEFPAEAWARACPTRGALMDNIFPLLKDYYRQSYGAVWVAMFNYRRDGLACLAPCYVVTRSVADDLAYYTLPDYLRKLASAVTQKELEGLTEAKAGGAAPGRLREYLAGKGLI